MGPGSPGAPSGLKKMPANVGDARDSAWIPGSGRSPGGGMSTQSSILACKTS